MFIMAHVQRLGSFGFEGGRGRQQYWRDPLQVLLSSQGDWRPCDDRRQQRQMSFAERVARMQPASDFGAVLRRALMGGDED